MKNVCQHIFQEHSFQCSMCSKCFNAKLNFSLSNLNCRANGGWSVDLDLCCISRPYPNSLFFMGLQATVVPFPYIDHQTMIISKAIRMSPEQYNATWSKPLQSLDLPLNTRAEPSNKLSRFEYWQLCRLFSAGDAERLKAFAKWAWNREADDLSMLDDDIREYKSVYEDCSWSRGAFGHKYRDRQLEEGRLDLVFATKFE